MVGGHGFRAWDISNEDERVTTFLLFFCFAKKSKATENSTFMWGGMMLKKHFSSSPSSSSSFRWECTNMVSAERHHCRLNHVWVQPFDCKVRLLLHLPVYRAFGVSRECTEASMSKACKQAINFILRGTIRAPAWRGSKKEGNEGRKHSTEIADRRWSQQRRVQPRRLK